MHDEHLNPKKQRDVGQREAAILDAERQMIQSLFDYGSATHPDPGPAGNRLDPRARHARACHRNRRRPAPLLSHYRITRRVSVIASRAGSASAAGGRGLATATEGDTACCYAVQDKVWVTGPGDELWEVYVVNGDADVLDKATDSVCCAPAAETVDAAQPAAAGTALPPTIRT